jgi:Raf kinase inhibitor-like YbhB/YbcL family protein
MKASMNSARLLSGALCSAAALVALSGCGAESDDFSANSTLQLSSTSINDGAIPKRFACVQGGATPALNWSTPPGQTASLAITVRDRDSPLQFVLGPFTHWSVYDLPASQTGLAEGGASGVALPDGAHQGTNGYGKAEFAGPCPPGSTTHHYEFKVYALDYSPRLQGAASLHDLFKSMRGHVVAVGTLIAHYP